MRLDLGVQEKEIKSEKTYRIEKKKKKLLMVSRLLFIYNVLYLSLAGLPLSFHFKRHIVNLDI